MDALDELQVLDLAIRIRNAIKSLESIRNRCSQPLSEEIDETILTLQYIMTDILDMEIDQQDEILAEGA